MEEKEVKGIKLISTILIVIILTPFFIINISNADETVVDVVFEDENLYEAIRLALGDKVLEYHKNTITITQSNLDSIVYLDLSKKNISNITGIRNFKKLATLYLNDNNISNINEISELTNLNFLRLDNNNIKNISFDMVNANSILINNYDVIVVDPPRGGLDKKTINNLLNSGAKKIVYVSCNTITLARDIGMLKEEYILDKITLFDNFPNTKHVESVCLLKLK